MATPLTMSIPHNLGKAEARRRIEQGFGNIEQSLAGGMLGMLSLQNRWENDTLHFEGGALRQKMSGSVEVLDDAVRLQVYLPDLLIALVDRVKETLKRQT